MVHVLHEIRLPDLCSLSHIAALCLYAVTVHPRPLLFSSLSLLELLTQRMDSGCCSQGLVHGAGKASEPSRRGAWQGVS